jgi:hypothetical protein
MSHFNIGVAKRSDENLDDLEQHNCRFMPNVKSTKSSSFSKNRPMPNKLIFGVPKVATQIRTLTSFSQPVKTKFGLKTRKPRKDSAKAIEIVFRVSADYFFNFDNDSQLQKFRTLRMDNPKEKKIIDKYWQTRLDKNKVQQVEDLVSDYVKNKFGENLVQLVAHFDEKGPHFHCVFLPITSDNRLSAKAVYNKIWLNTMLKECDALFKPLGLKRNKDIDAPAEHIPFNIYQSAPNEPETPPVFKIRDRLKVEDCVEVKTGILGNKEIPKKSIVEIIEHQKGLEQDYKKALQFYSTFYKNNFDKIRAIKQVEYENKELRKENKRMRTNTKSISEEVVSNLRSIDCNEVMSSLGIQGKAEGNSTRYKTDAINLVITEGAKFTENKNSISGGGAIDLLTKVFGYKFKEAVTFLAERFGTEPAVKNATVYKSQVQTLLKEKVEEEVKKLPIPESKKQNLDSVKTYLTEERKIDSTIVEDLVSKNLLYADKNKNCVFLNSKNTYAFLRGTYKEKRFVGTRGNQDFIEYQVGNSKNVYLFESCIEALSFQTMYPNLGGRYIVTNGSAMINKVKELDIDKNALVHCCFNNDSQGQKFCDKITKDLSSFTVESLTPVTKDWNEDLKNGNTVTKLANRNSEVASRTRTEAKII